MFRLCSSRVPASGCETSRLCLSVCLCLYFCLSVCLSVCIFTCRPLSSSFRPRPGLRDYTPAPVLLLTSSLGSLPKPCIFLPCAVLKPYAFSDALEPWPQRESRADGTSGVSQTSQTRFLSTAARELNTALTAKSASSRTALFGASPRKKIAVVLRSQARELLATLSTPFNGSGVPRNCRHAFTTSA